MDKISENFGDKLEKLAEAVDLLETADITNDSIEINVFVEESKFKEITNFLGHNETTTKCVVEIGNSKFIFSKK
jgi:hypothetical protein